MISYGIPLWDNPFDKLRNLSVCVNDNFVILLKADSTKIKFVSICPTTEELENFMYIKMTNKSPWDPNSLNLGELATHSVIHVTPCRIVNQVLCIILFPEQHMYLLPIFDEDLLHSIDPSLVTLKDRLLRKVEDVTPFITKTALTYQQRKKYVNQKTY